MTEKNIQGKNGDSLIARLGLPVLPWLQQAFNNADQQQQEGFLKVALVASTGELENRCAELIETSAGWQKKLLENKEQHVFQLSMADGPALLVDLSVSGGRADGMLEWDNDYIQARDLMGQLYAMFETLMAEQISMDFGECSDETVAGCLAGLEMAAYDYRHCRGDREQTQKIPGLQVEVSSDILNASIAKGQSVNVARHLVNLPAADLNPQSYAALVEEMFKGSASTTVTVWDVSRLKQEKMGLMLAVGKAAQNPPCLVHIRYRPAGCTGKPVAFIGKGVTFDSGGLDLKPSAFMRTMKKDMGGSAALVGIASWLDMTQFTRPVDIWLAIAENAVGQKAFRPGDVIHGRSGKSVEIDNTDAEGRLVLADALTVAATQPGEDKPAMLIDVATLTGAARVALGLQVGALFSSDRPLSDALYDAGLQAGDPLWPLPLVAAYKNELKSHVAQLVNSSNNRFGGAITAALFLAEFTEDIPWAHIDVNAWTNESLGPIKGPGANGQMVQCLINFLESGYEC